MKLNDIVFSVAVVGVCILAQFYMIGLDVCEWCREKVKGPRHTIDDM